MNWHERIVADPGVLAGKPVIRGTRMAVEFVLDLLAFERRKPAQLHVQDSLGIALQPE